MPRLIIQSINQQHQQLLMINYNKLKPTMLYFIRHAQSIYNYEADIKLAEQMGEKFSKKSPEFLALKFSPKYSDCGLTQNGRKQCYQTIQQVHKLPIKLVLVSPMRRTLETCYILFKQHPNRDKIKIVVDPEVREIFSSACDIGTRLRESEKQFGDIFDFSSIKNKDYWYLQSIKNEQTKKHLLSTLSSKLSTVHPDIPFPLPPNPDPSHSSIVSKLAFSIMLDHLQKQFKNINIHTFSNFQLQKNRLKSIGEEFGHVAVVSHHDNIITYTNRKTKNCEILKWRAQDL